MNLQQATNQLLDLLPEENRTWSLNVLLSSVLNIDTSEILRTDPNTELSVPQQKKFTQIASRLDNQEPIEYIVGWTEFYGSKIHVCKDVLIPRPETEGLVSLALMLIESEGTHNIAEVGTGTGCIGLSVCRELERSSKGYTYTGIEISDVAYSCTKSNFETFLPETSSSKVKLLNLGIDDQRLLTNNTFSLQETELIISNPPYITDQEMLTLDSGVANFEPELALRGGKDGLNVYRSIYNFCTNLNRLPIVILEISPATAEGVTKIFRDSYTKVNLSKDIFGRTRYCVCLPV